RNLLRLDHLALRLQLRIDAVEHVPDEYAGIAGDISGRPDRIEIGEIGVRHQAQGARVDTLRDGRGGETAPGGEGDGAGGRFDEIPAFHHAPPMSSFLRHYPRK